MTGFVLQGHIFQLLPVLARNDVVSLSINNSNVIKTMKHVKVYERKTMMF